MAHCPKTRFLGGLQIVDSAEPMETGFAGPDRNDFGQGDIGKQLKGKSEVTEA